MDTIVQMTLVLDVTLHRELCRLADASGRSMSWIADQALRRYLAAEEAAMAQGASPARPCSDLGGS